MRVGAGKGGASSRPGARRGSDTSIAVPSLAQKKPLPQEGISWSSLWERSSLCSFRFFLRPQLWQERSAVCNNSLDEIARPGDVPASHGRLRQIELSLDHVEIPRAGRAHSNYLLLPFLLFQVWITEGRKMRLHATFNIRLSNAAQSSCNVVLLCFLVNNSFRVKNKNQESKTQ